MRAARASAASHPAGQECDAPILSNPRSLLFQSLMQPAGRTGDADAFENRKGPAHDQGDLGDPQRAKPPSRNGRARGRGGIARASALRASSSTCASFAAPWPLHTRPGNLTVPLDGVCVHILTNLKSISRTWERRERRENCPFRRARAVSRRVLGTCVHCRDPRNHMARVSGAVGARRRRGRDDARGAHADRPCRWR